jgi:hypothetical protein
VLAELTHNLVQLSGAEAAASEEVRRGLCDELLRLNDPSGLKAGESGRAEAKLGDVHGRTESAGAQIELDVAHRCTAGKDVTI